MFLKPTELYILSIAAVITTIFTIVIFRCLPLILSSRRDAIIVTSSFLLFIILFKQSFVRADIQHMKGFMHYSALPISLLVLFGSNTIQNYSKGLLGLTIVFGFSYGAQNFQPGYISERWTGLLTYLSQASTSDLPAPVLEGQSILTNDAQSFVGGKTVDFIPWEISYIKYYNLNYRPRPVIQSFAALDEYLDGVNATMYQSSQAPEVVFFTLGAFDGRYDFFDEPQVKDTLASNYKSIGQSGGHLMLERRSDPIQVNKHLIYTGTSKINKTITLPTSQNQFIYLKAKIRYSSIGKLIRALYQPPELFIRFKFADKTSMTHRLLLPSLSSGVLINKHISRLIDAENFFNNKPELLTDISSIKIFSHDRWGFKPHFSYTLTTASR